MIPTKKQVHMIIGITEILGLYLDGCQCSCVIEIIHLNACNDIRKTNSELILKEVSHSDSTAFEINCKTHIHFGSKCTRLLI